MEFTWTKLQDFYLRLGFLKVLVALLDPDRRSISTEVLIRQLKAAIFKPAEEDIGLWAEPTRTSDTDNEITDKRELGLIKLLLISGKCPSSLYAITPKTAYKIVDWARDIGFLGPGNQITESAIILRHVLNIQAARDFLAGNQHAWNPFVITPEEKIYFLLVASNTDHLTLEIISTAGSSIGRILEARDAEELTCRALFRLLHRSETASPLKLSRLKLARELACTMSRELGIREFDSICSNTLIPRLPIMRHPKRSGGRERQTTKTADHQTIPRFEQLTDLGFMEKTAGPDASEKETFAARRHWRYRVSSACEVFRECNWSQEGAIARWAYTAFAYTSISAGLAYTAKTMPKPSSADIVRSLWDSYLEVRRSAGHTPAFSVAALSMVRAAARGIPLEMEDIHAVLLRIKKENLTPDHAFFASGNELENMFIVLRPGFLEQAIKKLDDQGKDYHGRY
jgi:hypothetical protein